MTDWIQTLPVTDEQMPPEEFARLHPVLKEDYTSSKPPHRDFKQYIILGILFLILALPVLDKLFVWMVPSLEGKNFVVVLLKTILFIFVLYILDKIQDKTENKNVESISKGVSKG